MLLRLEAKEGIRWFNGVFVITMILWIAIIATTYDAYRNIRSRIDSGATQQQLVQAYRTDSLNKTVSFSRYKSRKLEALEKETLNQLRTQNPGSIKYFLPLHLLYREGWLVSVSCLLFVTLLLSLFFELLKTPFRLQLRTEALERKLDAVYSKITALQHATVKDEPEDEEELN